jgi:putative nucleotidyltransferase with HDIG domain
VTDAIGSEAILPRYAKCRVFCGSERTQASGSRVDNERVKRVRIALGKSVWLIASVVAPLVVLGVLRNATSLDISNQSVRFHLIVVSSIAGLAAIVAAFAGAAAVRVRQPGVVLLAIGCLLCGTLMLVHGLVTPGVRHTRYGLWVGRAPLLAVLAFAVCQFVACFCTTTRAARFIGRHAPVVMGAVMAGAFLFAYLIVSDPSRLHGETPIVHELGLGQLVLLACATMLVPTAVRHWRRYRLGGDSLQAVLAIAATLSIASVMSIKFGKLWHLSWWHYHLYLLVAFGAVAVTVFSRYVKSRRISSLLANAFAVDPLEHIASSYPDALRHLVSAVETKDTYTHGHSRRTAHVATALGMKLRLQPEELRILAHGAYLHDVGKIAIPDEILNKPDRLTTEERDIIETHAEIGAQMVQEGADLEPCVAIVRHHHERFDGTGYPSHISGQDIPLLARVTAVADVWDALTSDRAYRPGWEPSDALAHIVAARGTHFDPTVVDALIELAAEWGYPVAGKTGSDAEAITVLQNCHDSRKSLVPEMSGSK